MWLDQMVSAFDSGLGRLSYLRCVTEQVAVYNNYY